MAFCDICKDTGSVPEDISNGTVTKWKDCPNLECKAYRDALHKDEDKIQTETYEPAKKKV